MSRMIAIGLFVAVLLSVCGCSIHFKGTDVELDAETTRAEKNATFELERVAFFDG